MSPARLLVWMPLGTGSALDPADDQERLSAAVCCQRHDLSLTAAPARTPITQSYHGNTLGALAVGGNAWGRKLFAPLLIDTHRVSPRSENRGERADETPLPIR